MPLHTLASWLLLSCVARQEGRLDNRQEVVSEAMAGHLGEAAQARDAVIAGDMAGARAALLALRARLPLAALAPQPARIEGGFIADVDAAIEAPDLPTLAEHLGEMAQGCGACHTASGLRIPVDTGGRVPTGQAGSTPTVTARMLLHQEADLVMWSALVAGDEGAFVSAAEAMRRSTLVPSGIAVDAPVPPLAAELEVRVQDLAALASRESDGRGLYLGRMLGTCAQCHGLLARGPAAP